MGRPSKYTPELVELICERLSKGEPLAQICRDKGMPHPSTVRDWISSMETVSRAIASARELGEDAIAADCLRIADEPPSRVQTTLGDSVDSGDVQHKRLRIDTRLKLLAKWNPRKWGDKMDVTSNGNPIPAPQIIAPGVGNKAE